MKSLIEDKRILLGLFLGGLLVIIGALAFYLLVLGGSNKRYVSRNLENCKIIDLACGPDERGFEDEIGCGCEKVD